MAKQKKNFYAVIKGHIAPAIFDSWAFASVVTTGYKGNDFKGFNTLQGAKGYMEQRGVSEYQIHENSGERGLESDPADGSFYAVAKGRERGIYRNYSNEAKAEVTGYSGACHKHFKTQDQAKAFNTNFEKAERFVSAVKLSQDTTLESIMGQLVIN